MIEKYHHPSCVKGPESLITISREIDFISSPVSSRFAPMKSLRMILPIGLLVFIGWQCRPIGPAGPGGVRSQQVSLPSSSMVTVPQMLREVGLKVDLVPRGTHGRKVVRPMRPRYITIHSTQNFSQGADAERHSMALKRGALRAPKRPGGNRIGYLIWHYTTDDRMAIQHMPVNEQGEHADFSGPGNRLSIGIEMCENRGSDLRNTVDRTAKLTAVLMKQHNIPLRNVVPHYHWPRAGTSQPNKNCPHFLLDHGRPGPKWRRFLARVDYHHKRMQ
jgi:N-acetylmuramoyl-L-alanine amidase